MKKNKYKMLLLILACSGLILTACSHKDKEHKSTSSQKSEKITKTTKTTDKKTNKKSEPSSSSTQLSIESTENGQSSQANVQPQENSSVQTNTNLKASTKSQVNANSPVQTPAQQNTDTQNTDKQNADSSNTKPGPGYGYNEMFSGDLIVSKTAPIYPEPNRKSGISYTQAPGTIYFYSSVKENGESWYKIMGSDGKYYYIADADLGY